MQVENCYYRVSVKALIYNEEGKFLLCKEETWVWDLPWWGLDHFENPIDWLKRELKEEMWLETTYINKKPKYFFTAHRITSEKRPWVANICYEVKVKDLNFIKSDECVEIWFFSSDEIKNIKALENVVEFSKQMSK
jgi:ADP-ribose pyrophosphatase YjhB (NUDIX family)